MSGVVEVTVFCDQCKRGVVRQYHEDEMPSAYVAFESLRDMLVSCGWWEGEDICEECA